MIFYSRSPSAFFDEAIYGPRKVSIIDPEFVWPRIEVSNPNYDPEEPTDSQTITINDPDVVPPMIEVVNPLCRIPLDAVEVSPEVHAALLTAQLDGKVIEPDADGNPVAIDPPPPSTSQIWQCIKAERDRLRFEGGVKVGGHWFLTNKTAATEYNSIINLGAPDATVIRPNWRTMDGAEVPMSPALAKQIIVAGFAQAAAIDDAALAHKSAMEASADPASYDFSADWPEVYGE